MLQKSYFPKGTPKDIILETIQKEEFNPLLITNSPNDVYPRHQHPEAKLLVCLEGSMEVEVKNEKFPFEPGDKLIIPGNTPHSAVVDTKGCTFYWSEKIL